MYQKLRMTSTPQVDMEELKRQLNRELLEEERRSSLTSIVVTPITTEPMSDQEPTGGGWPQGELLVVASPALHSSLEPDTIDNLAQPIACSLILIIGGSFRMEAGRGLVYPRQTMLDNIQIDASSYDVVKVDIVHENSKDLKLEVPPYDTMLTLRDGITRRLLWRMTSIDVDP
jgi:hypothetical protein